MTLAAGTSLGPYEVVGTLGAGGMGEVYRARDTRLKRDVAVKVLPPEWATDLDRLARLQREAEVLASLNHPNIASIYGLEDRALVIELVEGRTLAESQVPGSPLPVEEALAIARQIADALEYAHERGIIHRDLKPGNVKVTPDGVVKLLDFGLSKAIESPHRATDLTQSPTVAVGVTHPGVILGTAAYMAPEQARGKDADRRSDIWAFGVVLYELLTGTPAFRGDTTADILASVVRDDPDFQRVPSRARRLVRSCLLKDPRQRLQSIGDWRHLLDDPESVDSVPVSDRRSTRRVIAGLAGVLAASVGVAAWGWFRAAPTEPRAAIRFSVSFPDVSVGGPAALSRDGLMLALAMGPGRPIYLRALGDREAVPIRGTEGGSGASFSPDGTSLAFFTQSGGGERQLKRVPVGGGGAVTLAEGITASSAYTSWEDDETILYATNDGLYRVSAAAGAPKRLASIDGTNERFFGPQLLPGATQILSSVVRPGENVARIVAVNAHTGQTRLLIEQAGGNARYVPARDDDRRGHIVYGREGSLFAAPFDVRSLAIGTPVPVIDDVMSVGAYAVFNISRSGTLVYADAGARRSVLEANTLIWKDRRGNENAVPGPPRAYVNIRLSHSGTSAAVSVQRAPLRLPPLVDLGVVDLARGTLTPLTRGGTAGSPAWSLDDRQLWFMFTESNPSTPELKVVPADGSGVATVALGLGSYEPGMLPFAVFPRPDGPIAILRRDENVRAGVTTLLSLRPNEATGATAKPQPLFSLASQPSGLALSPDGGLLAYQSDETGRGEVWVTPYPGPGARVLVSTEGGGAPRWNPKGRELFYRNEGKLMVVNIDTAPVLRAGTPRMLFDTPELRTASASRSQRLLTYDVAPDGERFLLLKPESMEERSNELHVVVNWADELARKVPLSD